MQPPIFVINLDTSPERFSNTQAQFEQINVNVTRLQGVLGKALSESEINEVYSPQLNFAKSDRALSKGEIGCYASHRKAWQQIVDMEVPFGIVAEDDIIVEPFLQEALDMLKALTIDWDLIKLAPYKNTTRPVVMAKQINARFELVINRKTITGCAGYALSRKAAMKLLKSTSPFYRPVDTDLQHFWEHDIDIYALQPFVIKQDLTYDSDIGTSRKNISRRKLKKIGLQVANYFANKSATKAACERFKQKFK